MQPKPRLCSTTLANGSVSSSAPPTSAVPVVRQDPTAFTCHELADRYAADWEQLTERLLGGAPDDEALAGARPVEPPGLPADAAPPTPGAAAAVPASGQWHCRGCRQTVSGTVAADPRTGELVLSMSCAVCGPRRETLRDGRLLVPAGSPTARAGSPAGGARALPVALDTLCPECSSPLLGRAFAADDSVWLEKTCPRHGYFRDRLDSDVSLYLRLLASRAHVGAGRAAPAEPLAACDGSTDGVLHVTLDRVEGRATRTPDPALAAALRAMGAARRRRQRVCLQARIMKSFNDDQVGPLLRFAAANSDVVDALLLRPAAFGAPLSMQQLLSRRYTLGELAKALAREGGADLDRDFLPLDDLAPVWRFLGRLGRRPRVGLTAAGRPAFGTYFVVLADGELTPLPKLVDPGPMLALLEQVHRAIARRGPAARATWVERLRVALGMLRHYRPGARTGRLSPWVFVRALRRRATDQAPGWTAPLRLLLVAGIQEPDRYNFVPASTPSGGGQA